MTLQGWNSGCLHIAFENRSAILTSRSWYIMSKSDCRLLASYCNRRLNAASITGWNLARNSAAS
jgi:hypothetical protein